MLRILNISVLVLSFASTAWGHSDDQAAHIDGWLHQADAWKTTLNNVPELQRAQQVSPEMTQGSSDEMAVPEGTTHAANARSLTVKAQPVIHPQVVVLVSFSLPDVALQSLYQQLQPLQGELVFRGAPGNNLQLMQQRLQRLQIRAVIDPWWFRYLQVTKVPAFVLLLTTWHRGSLHPGDAVILTGLVDIRTALDFMGRNSSDQRVVAEVATLQGRLIHD